MKSTKGLNLRATKHAEDQIIGKGYRFADVQRVFESGNISPNGKFPGQFRIAGNGICLVGQPNGDTFKLITVYADGVMTPPRPDQLKTPEGREYARRYREGLHRNNEYRPRKNKRKGNDVIKRRQVS